ncbi:MAG: hypothetical protein LBD67_08755 [Candidatus Accumulibacter sp.]|jgi:hypothetical protein|nr:hypothetical protein [Accumulibacter sp.]
MGGNEENLFVLMARVRRDIKGLPDALWERILWAIARRAGGERIYVPRPRKAQLEDMLLANASLDNRQLSKLLGISIRRVQQLKKAGGVK